MYSDHDRNVSQLSINVVCGELSRTEVEVPGSNFTRQAVLHVVPFQYLMADIASV